MLGSTPIGEAARSLVLPAKNVGPAQLKPDAVTSGKVKSGSLPAVDFKQGQVSETGELTEHQVGLVFDSGEAAA